MSESTDANFIGHEPRRSRPTRYRVIDVAGSPREIGRAIGESARNEIRGFVAIALERVNKTVRISRESAMAVAAESIAWAERYSPEMIDELRGTAEASGASLEDLMLLQVRNQLQSDSVSKHAPADSGCTSLSLGCPFAAGHWLAQNWDADPALDPFTVVLIRRPIGKPAMMCVTQAGLIAYIGLSDAGMGVCLNTLPAPSRRLGVPHYFTVRGIYESRSLDEAVEAVRRAERAIPANIMLATPDGPANLEITLDDVHVLRGDSLGRLTHTNHCRHADLAPINDRFPELIQSYARLCRIDQLLNRPSDSAAPPAKADRDEACNADGEILRLLQTALRDHDGYPRSICRHTNDDPSTGYWQTVFSVVLQPDRGRMYVTRGTPCDREYELYEL